MTGRCHIGVVGSIGAGKSTLIHVLAPRLGGVAVPEPVDENPFLADFYADRPRWAFASQLFFLHHRIRQCADLAESNAVSVQERIIQEDAEIFARYLWQDGALSGREYALYRDIYQAALSRLRPPDLVLYLRADPERLWERIATRARPAEGALTRNYLESITALYERWLPGFDACPVLTVDANEDLRRPEALSAVELIVRETLPGLRRAHRRNDIRRPPGA